MADLPHPWDAYLRLQSQLATSNQINDRNWGLEAALNSIVSPDGDGASALELDRTIASAARNSRHRVMLRRKYLPDPEPKFDPEPSLEARAQLRLVRTAVTENEWDLLTAIGTGHEYEELGLKASPGALRVKVRRLRERIAQAA